MSRKTEAPTETRPATFSLEDPALKAIMAEAVATALAAQRAELLQAMADQQQALKPQPQAASAANSGKSEQSQKNEIAVIRAFKKAGFGTVVPYQDVLTFNRWVSQGFRPIEGSKSLKVGTLRLFHKSQCRPIGGDEAKAMQKQQAEAIKRQEGKGAKGKGTVTQLHPAS